MPSINAGGDPWLVIRHVEHEHIGTLARVLERTGAQYECLDMHRGAVVPGDPGRWGGLIVMGGPMGVYEADRYPFLAAEMRLIRRAAEAGQPVIGICLGAQLIAGALGARVYPGSAKEIGWHEVEVVALQEELLQGLPAKFMAFHWHGDTFDLPQGAARLFRSRLYENQGFRWGGHVFALQFHMEVSAAMIAEWLEDPGCRAEIATVQGLAPQSILRDTELYAAGLERLSEKLFSRVLSRAADRDLTTRAAGKRQDA